MDKYAQAHSSIPQEETAAFSLPSTPKGLTFTRTHRIIGQLNHGGLNLTRDQYNPLSEGPSAVAAGVRDGEKYSRITVTFTSFPRE